MRVNGRLPSVAPPRLISAHGCESQVGGSAFMASVPLNTAISSNRVLDRLCQVVKLALASLQYLQPRPPDPHRHRLRPGHEPSQRAIRYTQLLSQPSLPLPSIP